MQRAATASKLLLFKPVWQPASSSSRFLSENFPARNSLADRRLPARAVFHPQVGRQIASIMTVRNYACMRSQRRCFTLHASLKLSACSCMLVFYSSSRHNELNQSLVLYHMQTGSAAQAAPAAEPPQRYAHFHEVTPGCQTTL